MILVKDLTKKFDDFTAVNDVSFEIQKGEICGYIGTNGAGKSTTVKILTGILDFNKGSVLINDLDIKKDPVEVKKIIGYVPENANLFNSLSPVEFLNFTGKVRDLTDKVISERINSFAEMFGFTDLVNDSIGNLSKGNKQKVMITSALIHDPHVIFLDEPLNGLDTNSIFVFHDLIRFLAGKGKTIFYCSHHLNIIEKISTKIILINKGRIELDINTSELSSLENYTDLEKLFRDLNSEDSSESKKFNFEDLYN
ncbi:MAG TPA: ABC transporter ATP-binding protein [Ignavibacteria bacterium]|nr:ABC transporter ATP-binding protein [Ignavibacteria bacterium]